MIDTLLLSPLGDSDPVRDLHDGSMLHIVRHHRPQVVYLLLTQAVAMIDKQTNAYELAIKHVHPNCQVEKIFTGIENPSEFDSFYAVFSKTVADIALTHPGAKVLVNVSSGTPQMKTAACLEIVTATQTLTPIQVLTPARSSNKKAGFTSLDTPQDVADALANNLDDDPNSPNRCQEPGLLSIRQHLLKSQLLSLIQSYQYTEAYHMVKQNQSLFSQRAYILAEHAYMRSVQHKETPGNLRRYDSVLYSELYPVQNAEPSKVVEFYNVAKLLKLRDAITDFTLRVSALTEFLLKKETHTTENYIGARELDERLQTSGLAGYDILWEEKFKRKRNGAAHGLQPVTESDYKSLNITSDRVLRDLKIIIKRLYKGQVPEAAFDIYDTINAKLTQEVSQ